MAALNKEICPGAALRERGAAVCFSVEQGQHRRPAFAIRFNGKAYAYLNQCGHRPLPLDWQPGQVFDQDREFLICATHGALYAPNSGECVGGPCNGNGLRQLAILEQDGYVYLTESNLKLADTA